MNIEKIDLWRKITPNEDELKEKLNEVIEVVNELSKDNADKKNADGCCGCAFMDKSEFDMPCKNCKRNAKDYWRRGAE